MYALDASAFPGAEGLQSSSAANILRILDQQLMKQSTAHLEQSTLVTRALTKTALIEMIRTISLKADEHIASQQSSRLLEKLASRFKLIEEMQRSLG